MVIDGNYGTVIDGNYGRVIDGVASGRVSGRVTVRGEGGYQWRQGGYQGGCGGNCDKMFFLVLYSFLRSFENNSPCNNLSGD